MKVTICLAISSLWMLSSGTQALAESAQQAVASIAVAQERIEERVVAPLRVNESIAHAFTRARVVPRRLEAMLLGEGPLNDARERAFVAFRVEETLGDGSRKPVTSGCYYPDRDRVFLMHGDRHVPASSHPLISKQPLPADAGTTSRCLGAKQLGG